MIKIKNAILVFSGLSLLILSTVSFSSNYQISAPGISLNANQLQALNKVPRQSNKRRSKYANTSHKPSISAANNNTLALSIHSLLDKRKQKNIVNQRQKMALNDLTKKTLKQGGLNRKFSKINGTPTFLQGIMTDTKVLNRNKTGSPDQQVGAKGTIEKKSIARNFLRNNRALLKLDAPDKEFKLVREKSDVAGKHHFLYQQLHNGVPVWGKQAAVHLNQKNQVYLFNGRYIPTLSDIDTTPVLNAEEALAAANLDLGINSAEFLSNELMIFMTKLDDKPEVAVLVYTIDIKPSMYERWLYFVDASTAEIVHRIKNIHNVGTSVPASGVDLFNNTQSFKAWQDNSTVYMIDPTFPLADISFNPLVEPNNKGDTYIFDVNNGDGSDLSFVQSNSAYSGWDSTAVSAFANTITVYNYWFNTHQRKSLDDNNKNLMVAIHMGENFNNAFWNGTFMVYGDGDNQLFGPLAKCLDVAGHEMSHGVIEHTANLIYQNQSGALNESFADVFGAMVDRDDWLIGEDCTIAAPGHLRNMQNPANGLSRQPTKMSEYKHLPNTDNGDNGGVHINSGIPNRAAYLVAEGLTLEGSGTSIGREKLEKIWYKALKDYLTASSEFVDARRATIQATKDLYGETAAEVTAVTMAWNLVEVTEESVASPDSKTPTKTDVVVGGDYMVYLYPIDDTHDQALTDQYDVYAQALAAPDYEYDKNSDLKLNYTTHAAYTQPAAYTDEIGTIFFYVSENNNLWRSDGVNFDEPVTNTDDIASIAISSDGRYFAYTSVYANDNTIHLIDLEADANTTAETTIPLTPPDYQQDGSSVGNTIYYADSLAFDYTSKLLVFDALNCISIPGSDCSATGEGGYFYWSVGVANIDDKRISYPFPSQDPAIDLGYPSFASNSNTVIALDMQDYNDVDTNGVSSKVISLDFTSQQINTVVDFGYDDFGFWGVPSFWGDDAAITVLSYDASVGSVADRIPLNENYVRDENVAISPINPFAVAMPIMHRAGQRVLSGTLSIDNLSVNLSDAAQGNITSQEIRITNQGNRDVAIQNIVLNGSAFKHNLTNTLIPRNATLIATVSLKSDVVAGTHSGSLVLSTDGDPATITISLTAAVGVSVGSSDNKKSSNFLGCSLSSSKAAFDPIFLLLIMLSLVYIFRRNKAINF